MKRIIACLAILLLFPAISLGAGTRQDRVTTKIFAVDTIYEEKVTNGVTKWQTRSETPQLNQMGFSGTSPAQVIDLSKMVIDGSFTFQFESIGGSTEAAVAGTTIAVYWRGSNIDRPSSWIQATRNQILDVDVYSGITDVGYDINNITAVTEFKYFRIEFEGGVSPAAASGIGNESSVTPTGILFIR